MKKLNIPKNFRGRNSKEDYERVLAREDSPEEEKTEIKSFNGEFTKSDYIQIPNQNFIIAIAETDKNLNYEEVNKTLIQKGLAVPTINEFMIFHNYFHDAYKNNKQIFNANANPIPDNTKNDLYKQLTEDCWTWLNGKFNISDTSKTIEYITGLNSKGEFITQTENLENYLIENCFIDFTNLTKQGLPKTKHSNNKFVKGENIYYWKPENEKVARFDAYSGRAYLNCIRSPSYSNSDLGVRAVRRE